MIKLLKLRYNKQIYFMFKERKSKIAIAINKTNKKLAFLFGHIEHSFPPNLAKFTLHVWQIGPI